MVEAGDQEVVALIEAVQPAGGHDVAAVESLDVEQAEAPGVGIGEADGAETVLVEGQVGSAVCQRAADDRPWRRGEDFGGSAAAVLDHVRKYASPALKQQLEKASGIANYDYDWTLNEVKR